MMSRQQKLRIAQYYIDSINAHDLRAMGECLADGLRVEVATGAECPMDKLRFLAYNENYMKAFPDVHFDITLTVSEGAFVAMNWNASGTQTASLATPSGGIIVATGVKVYAPGSFTFRLQEGKISHAWVFWDMATMLAQLGLLPPL
jgi:steroid delta-isomerase-like uncharacterized protein